MSSTNEEYVEGIYLNDGTLKKFKDADLTQKVAKLSKKLVVTSVTNDRTELLGRLLIARTNVLKGTGAGFVYVERPMANYTCIGAANGDWDSFAYAVTGLSMQGYNAIVHFSANIPSGKSVRVNTLWVYAPGIVQE